MYPPQQQVEITLPNFSCFSLDLRSLNLFLRWPTTIFNYNFKIIVLITINQQLIQLEVCQRAMMFVYEANLVQSLLNSIYVLTSVYFNLRPDQTTFRLPSMSCCVPSPS